MRGRRLAGIVLVGLAACGGGELDARAPAQAIARPCVLALSDAGDAGTIADAGVAAPIDGGATEAPVAAPETRPQAIAALVATLREQIAREAQGVPEHSALVVALVTDDVTPPLVVAHGNADLEAKTGASADSVFRIASVTKTFTAAAVLALRDAGAIRLDDKVSRLLKELDTTSSPHKDAPALTYRHLLLHAGGLPRSGPWATKEADYRSTEEEVLEASQKLALDPGLRHSYSNLGYAVLGLAVARATKAPYRDFVERRFLGPLGMRSTTFDETRLPAARLARGYVERAGGGIVRAAPIANGAAEGAGGLWSSANDLARWVRFQLAAWPPRDDADKGPLRRASLRESHVGALDVELVTETTSEGTATRARSQGLGWKVERSCAFEHLVEHGGDLGGYRSRLFFLPQRGLGLVVLANATATPVDAISRRLLGTIAEARGLGPRDGAPPAGFVRCVP